MSPERSWQNWWLVGNGSISKAKLINLINKSEYAVGGNYILEKEYDPTRRKYLAAKLIQ